MGYLIAQQLGDLGGPSDLLRAVRAGVKPREFFATRGYQVREKPGGGFTARKSNLGVKNLGRAIVGTAKVGVPLAVAAFAAPAIIKAATPIVRGLVKPGTATIMPGPGLPIGAPITLPTPSPIAKLVGSVIGSGVRHVITPAPAPVAPAGDVTIMPGPGLPIGAPIVLPAAAQPIDTPREGPPIPARGTPGWVLPAVGFAAVALMVLMHPRKRRRS